MNNVDKAVVHVIRQGGYGAGKTTAQRIERAKAAGERHCKHCGCTHLSPCFDSELQSGCCWVSRNECSVCRPDLLKAALKKAGLA